MMGIKNQAQGFKTDLATIERHLDRLKSAKSAADIVASALDFAASARTGWSYAISRALEAEIEVQHLRRALSRQEGQIIELRSLLAERGVAP